MEKMAENFQIKETIKQVTPYGNGHINETFLVKTNGEQRAYIMQKMNTEVFKQPERVMENISSVTSCLRKQIISEKGDPDRQAMQVIPTKNGTFLYRNQQGEVFRMFLFIQDAICLDKPESGEDCIESAKAFGLFQHQLSKYPAETLHETISHFHDTSSRYQQLYLAERENVSGRREQILDLLSFARERQQRSCQLDQMRKSGQMPLRVTHNDTKLNNVMLDRKTRKALCVIDLDTVMPGLAVHDFGDLIRFGANKAVEDETDLTKVGLDDNRYRLFHQGFLEGCGNDLTREEIEQLPLGAYTMTMECGIRFLADYLNGDRYFKIHHKEQNLDRARCQFALAKDMEKAWNLG